MNERRGEQNGRAKLTDDQARQIYKLAWEEVWTQQHIGEMFGVGRPMVAHIKYRRSWKHLWEEEEESDKPMIVKSGTEATGEHCNA
jgi:hypothetical protein